MRGVLFAFTALTLALSTAAPAAEGPNGISFKPRGDGWVLVDGKGKTLYHTARDIEPGKSSCNEGCSSVWPPVEVAADVALDGEWSAFTREDGVRQLAYRGQPLYAYSLDREAGDGFGDDVGRVWHVAHKPIFTPPEATIAKTALGRVLADSRRMTLYVSDAEKDGKANCNAACTAEWPPLSAPWGATTKGDWTPVARADGTKQWTFRGRPLHRFAGDAQPGQALGEGNGGQWHALVLEPPPPLPSWVRIIESDAGELYTDSQGRTLYQRQPPRRRRVPDAEDINPNTSQLPPNFNPVTVASTGEIKPVGNWSIVEVEGVRQWAYKGLALYTNELDIAPGDLKGFRGGDRQFHTIMVSGEPMQGTGQ